MIDLLKADVKKIFYLSNNRKYIVAVFLLSILLGLVFLFTLGVTEGKKLTDLSSLEVMGVILLGIDVTAIMLIIFTAGFIAKEFSNGSIHTSLAITPQRQKFYLAKNLFIILLSLVISLILLLIIIGIGQLVLSMNNMELVSLVDEGVIFKLVGALLLAPFYSLLSAVGAFFLRSAAGGITFSLGVMFFPALIKLFPSNVSDTILFVFPEKSLNVITEMGSLSFNGSIISALLILLSWILISYFVGLGKFRKVDF